MVHFFCAMGITAWPLLLLAVVIVVLVIQKTIALFFRSADPANPGLTIGLNAILFWGGAAAVLGILGQLTGIYNALQVIIRATEISPRVIAAGLAESFTTTIAGLAILICSAVAWIVLRGRYDQLTRRSRRERP